MVGEATLLAISWEDRSQMGMQPEGRNHAKCLAKSWMEIGTPGTPVEYLCDVAHAQARYLGLVGESAKVWEVTDGKKRVERFSARPVY